MKLKKFFGLFAVCAVTVLLTGNSSCQNFLDDPDKVITEKTNNEPNYVVTIHTVVKYKRAESIEIDVDSFFGGTVTINQNPIIHSRDIKEIIMVPRPGNANFYDLKLMLTSRGHKLWSSMAVSRMENKKFCILIDGMFYRNIVPQLITEPASMDVLNENMQVYVDGPFDQATAKGIQDNAKRNYKIYNPSSSLTF